MPHLSKVLLLGLMLLSSQTRASGVGGDEDEKNENKISLPCEVEPELLHSSRPSIPGRQIVITTWQMSSRRTPSVLYFTFVFDRDTNTPDRPIYALEGRIPSHSILNHEAAEEWVALQIQGISPLILTPIEEPEPIALLSIPPPIMRRQTTIGVETPPEFSVHEVNLTDSQSATPESESPSQSELRSLEEYLFSPRNSLPGLKWTGGSSGGSR